MEESKWQGVFEAIESLLTEYRDHPFEFSPDGSGVVRQIRPRSDAFHIMLVLSGQKWSVSMIPFENQSDDQTQVDGKPPVPDQEIIRVNKTLYVRLKRIFYEYSVRGVQVLHNKWDLCILNKRVSQRIQSEHKLEAMWPKKNEKSLKANLFFDDGAFLFIPNYQTKDYTRVCDMAARFNDLAWELGGWVSVQIYS